MTQVKQIRDALRTVGNELSLDGDGVAAALMIKLAAFAHDQALIQLFNNIKEIGDNDG